MVPSARTRPSPRRSVITSTNTTPMRKEGRDSAISANPRDRASGQRDAHSAAGIPSTMVRARASSSATTVSNTVAGSLLRNSSEMGRPVAQDGPRSPRTRPVIQSR